MGQGMKDNPGILHDIRTIRDIEGALNEAETFIDQVRSHKVHLTLDKGVYNVSRDDMTKIADLISTLEKSGKALGGAITYLRDIMAYDETTRMFSRRYIFHLLEKELSRAKRYSSNFAIMVLEMDPMAGGVTAADETYLVAEAAREIRKFVRESDSPGRTAERTFMILLPETDLKGAKILAERIRAAIDHDYDLSTGKARMTVSGAIINGADPNLDDMAALLYMMDQKLAEARSKSPNVIVG